MTTEEKTSIISNYENNLKNWLFAKTDKERDRYYHFITGMESILDSLKELKGDIHSIKEKVHDMHYQYGKNKIV